MFSGKWRQTLDVAVKQLRNDRVENLALKKAKSEFFQEVNVHKKLSGHPNILKESFSFNRSTLFITI